MHLDDFDYLLPPELVAQAPLPQRSASRLLAVSATGSVPPWRDLAVRDLPDLLQPGDLLVFNDTRVVPARLQARKATGGQVELLLERALADGSAWVQARPGRGLAVGSSLDSPGGALPVLERRDDLWRIGFPVPVFEFLERWGAVPLPPYIGRDPDATDRERYQSIFARASGAAAAPTASLHFDAELLAALAARGVGHAFVTLHVGAGTFQPVRTEDPTAHRIHAEWIDVPHVTCDLVTATRARGGRVVAVGTTVVRSLEAAARTGVLLPFQGDTDLYILPGHRWQVVDALVTNFHVPRSTLLMLVCAFAGQTSVLAAYRHAVAQRYRFFSYGDAMYLERARAAAA